MKRKLTKVEWALLTIPLVVLFSLSWQYFSSKGKSVTLGQTLPAGTKGNGSITSLAFSPDGKLLAAVSTSSQRAPGGWPIQVWSVSSRQLQLEIGNPRDDAIATAFSPDGKLLAVVVMRPTEGVQLWDLKTSRVVTTLPTGYTHSVAFSPNGDFITASRNGLNIWDTKTGQIKKTIAAQVHLEASIAVSHDGQFIAFAAPNRYFPPKKGLAEGRFVGGTGLVYDLRNGNRKVLSCKFPISFCFAPQNSTLIVKTNEVLPSGRRHTTGQIMAFEATTGRKLWVQEDNALRGLAFSPDGQFLATEYESYGIKIREAKAGNVVRVINAPRQTPVFFSTASSIAWSSDNSTIACTDDQNIKLWAID